jgi:hypothetical protein
VIGNCKSEIAQVLRRMGIEHVLFIAALAGLDVME